MPSGSAVRVAQAPKAPAEHQEQLDRLTAEVQALREELRRAQRLATMGTMTAIVAHEFNNILTPIINYAQMAKTNPALADKAIARAADGGQRASHICNAILSMAGGAASTTPTPLRELVEQTLAAMAREPKKDCIELTLDVPEDLTITTNRVELQQVLLNLLLNARSALLARSGSRTIEIQAVQEEDTFVLRVADNGVGIPPENLDKIFQPFFTTKPHEGENAGHGLGLAFCREIVSSMKGTISVQSTQGEGATFIVRLPR